MGLRRFPGRGPAPAGPDEPAPVVNAPRVQERLAPGRLADLEQAWAALATAVAGADVITFQAHTCDRTAGEENTAAVRGPAAP